MKPVSWRRGRGTSAGKSAGASGPTEMATNKSAVFASFKPQNDRSRAVRFFSTAQKRSGCSGGTATAELEDDGSAVAVEVLVSYQRPRSHSNHITRTQTQNVAPHSYNTIKPPSHSNHSTHARKRTQSSTTLVQHQKPTSHSNHITHNAAPHGRVASTSARRCGWRARGCALASGAAAAAAAAAADVALPMPHARPQVRAVAQGECALGRRSHTSLRCSKGHNKNNKGRATACTECVICATWDSEGGQFGAHVYCRSSVLL